MIKKTIQMNDLEEPISARRRMTSPTEPSRQPRHVEPPRGGDPQGRMELLRIHWERVTLTMANADWILF